MHFVVVLEHVLEMAKEGRERRFDRSSDGDLWVDAKSLTAFFPEDWREEEVGERTKG